jgi:hypothetical protein
MFWLALVIVQVASAVCVFTALSAVDAAVFNALVNGFQMFTKQASTRAVLPCVCLVRKLLAIVAEGSCSQPAADHQHTKAHCIPWCLYVKACSSVIQ